MADDKQDDDFFPGFAEDDKPSAKPTFAPPPAPPPAAGGEPAGFNPFADAPPSGDPAAMPPAPAPAAANIGAAIMDEAQQEAGDEDGDEGEVRPGQGKDLWTCPHCGAKNKPKRTTCRSCSKSPDEAVVPVWQKQLPAILGAAAVVVIGLLLWSFLAGPSFALTTPAVANIDDAIRRDTSGGATISLADDRSFTVRGRIAACGRVVAVEPSADPPFVVLAFGESARHPEQAGQLRWQGNGVVMHSTFGDQAKPFAQLVLAEGDLDRAEVGGVYSLTGSWGDVTDGAASAPASHRYLVAVKASRAGP